MPLQQAHAAEAQKTLGDLFIFRLLQANASSGRQYDCAHQIPFVWFEVKNITNGRPSTTQGGTAPIRAVFEREVMRR
jgi:hypothetical protein